MRAGQTTLKTTLGALAATLLTMLATLPLATTTAPAAGAATTHATTSEPTTWTPPAASYGEAELSDQPVTMSDGAVLRADVFYPTVNGTTTPAAGPFPVLLQQTPYGKAFIGTASALDAFVNRGYIVVVSDVRGTGDSDGDFDLFAPVQATDGATMARWAAALPHSDGQVGLFGESYMGINQFMTVGASGKNTPVKAMFPIISGNDIFANTVTMGGIPDLEFSAAYAALLSGLDLTNPVLQPLVEAAENDNPAELAAGLARLTPVEAAHATTLTSFLNLIIN
ncbi:MAG TPA: CocE/NonD family hydrolase, partial [Acidimicrobiales bacterium]